MLKHVHFEFHRSKAVKESNMNRVLFQSFLLYFFYYRFLCEAEKWDHTAMLLKTPWRYCLNYRARANASYFYFGFEEYFCPARWCSTHVHAFPKKEFNNGHCIKSASVTLGIPPTILFEITLTHVLSNFHFHRHVCCMCAGIHGLTFVPMCKPCDFYKLLGLNTWTTLGVGAAKKERRLLCRSAQIYSHLVNLTI